MQTDPVELAAELWRNLLDYIPARERDAAAEQMIIACRRLEFTDDDLENLADYDRYLAEAVAQDAEEQEESDSDDYGDDEDYEDDRY